MLVKKVPPHAEEAAPLLWRIVYALAASQARWCSLSGEALAFWTLFGVALRTVDPCVGAVLPISLRWHAFRVGFYQLGRYFLVCFCRLFLWPYLLLAQQMRYV